MCLQGVCGEMHTDHQGLWTQSSLQVLFSIRTLYSNQSFGFSLNTLCLLLPPNCLPSSPFYLHHPPQILQVWLLLIVQLSSERSQTQRKRSCYPSLCWPSAVCPSPSLVLFWVLSRFSRVRLFATLWTVASQASLSMGFSRPEYWSGLPFPSPGR